MNKTISGLTVQDLIDELLQVEDKAMKVNIWTFSSGNGHWSELTSDIELSIDEDGYNIFDA